MTEINRLPVTLTAAGERALRAGHPWLFDGAIQKIKGNGKAGDLAIVFSYKKNKCIGVGLYDPGSPIRVRVLHAGGPARVDEDFLREKLAAAREKRTELLATDTTGYRLVHGENDGLPGVVVDVYAGVAVLKLYSPVWLPWLEMLQPLVIEISKAKASVLRLARNVEGEAAGAGLRDGAVLWGDLPAEELTFKEYGLSFYANVVRGHKTGFFLDHRANRKRVGELAAGQEVLDVFSYAGGFSVHALGGGATSVTSLDISGPALAQAKRNIELNFGDTAAYETIEGDAFVELEQLAKADRAFGVVVVDPPSFAKRESEVTGALKAYRKVNRLALPLIAPGGILVAASCSARITSEDFFQVIASVVAKSGRKHQLLEKTFHDVDHPVGFPEGAYLKTVYYRVW